MKQAKRSGFRFIRLACWVAMAAMSIPSQGTAATNYYYVGSGSGTPPYDTWAAATNNIQAAVDEAVGDLGGGTVCIVTVTDGVFAVSSAINLNGAITLRSLTDAASTIVTRDPATPAMRIFDITAAGAVLDGFTVTNGYLNTYGENGVGIRMTVAATVRNCRIVGNVGGNVSYGGGILISAGTLRDSVVENNSSGQGGGGYLYGSGVISNCTFLANRSQTGWARGGALRMDGGLLESCVISENMANNEGGGVMINGGTVRNCLFYDNSAGTAGGGLWVNGGTVQNCTVAANESSSTGGGVHQQAGTIRNTICYFNDSVGAGDNLSRTAGTFTNSCVTPAYLNNVSADPQFVSHAGRNYRLLPGSPCLDMGAATGSVAYDIEGNPRPTNGDGAGGAAYDIGAYEAEAATSGVLRCNFSATDVGGFQSLDTDFTAYTAGSNLTGLAYRWSFGDGTTNDWPGSPSPSHTYGPGAFDVTLWVTNAAGETSSWTKTDYIAVYPAFVYVKPTGSPVWPYDTWAKATTNLLAAVDTAGVYGPNATVVTITNGVYTLTNAVAVDKGITVRGVSRDDVTIDGGHAVRCFHMTDPDAVVESLTISNGYATGGGVASRGCGVYLASGTLTNCVVRNCESAGGASGESAGAVYIESLGVARNCQIIDNRAAAGMAGAGVAMSYGVLRDSVVSRNTFLGNGSGSGGGVYCNYGAISNCTITCNTNTYRGGGVFVNYAAARVVGCTIAQNVSRDGAGLYADAALIERCVIASNNMSVVASEVAGGGATIRNAILRSCGIWANRGNGGGGVYMHTGYANSRIENCTIVGNSANTSGGGVRMDAGTATNTIVYFNDAATGDDIGGSVTNFGYSCSPVLTGGAGNDPADPTFVANGIGYGLSHQVGDYHLQGGSPCANTGANSDWMTSATDLEGNSRILSGVVNMGAYELIVLPKGTVITVR